MPRYMSLDQDLLKDYEFPVCLVVEVTKQGVLLSKLRYLKSLGQIVNETIRCPVIEVYMHMGKFMDPFLFRGGARPIGIDWIFTFELNKPLFRDTVAALRSGKAQVNRNNPMVEKIVSSLMRKVNDSRVHFKRLDPTEKGLLLEPYCKLAFQRAGKGKVKVLQNVELVDREASVRVRGPGYEDIYSSEPGPAMEIDILVIAEISDVRDLLDGLGLMGFFLDRPS